MMTNWYLLTPLVAFGAIHCATTSGIVWESGDEFVHLVDQDKLPYGRTLKNDHPADISSEALVVALGSLRLDAEASRRWDEDPPVLNARDRRRLAPHLSRAFSAASPRQDVVFSVRTWAKGPMFGKQRASIDCRVFIQNDQLNVIVGNLFSPTTQDAMRESWQTTTEIDRRRHPYRPGTRSKVRVPEFALATGEGVRFFEEDGRTRPDWVVIDLQEVFVGVEYSEPTDGANAEADLGCTQPSFPDAHPDISPLTPPKFVTEIGEEQLQVHPGDELLAEITVNGATRQVFVELNGLLAEHVILTQNLDTPGNETIRMIFLTAPENRGRFYMRLTLCGVDCDERRVVFDIIDFGGTDPMTVISSTYERTLIENGEVVRVDRTCVQPNSVLIK